MSTLRSQLESLDAVTAARQLLGATLTREIMGEIATVRIVETEAYLQTDAASHSYKGRTPRTDVMFGPAGHLYVYFTYGMHYCCNVVIGEEDYGATVLIRAVEPIDGHNIMSMLRSKTGIELTNGPAKLCQALAIDHTLNGHNLETSPLQLKLVAPLSDDEIVTTARIGISQAVDEPWRFYIQGNPYVSRQ